MKIVAPSSYKYSRAVCWYYMLSWCWFSIINICVPKFFDHLSRLWIEPLSLWALFETRSCFETLGTFVECSRSICRLCPELMRKRYHLLNKAYYKRWTSTPEILYFKKSRLYNSSLASNIVCRIYDCLRVC